MTVGIPVTKLNLDLKVLKEFREDFKIFTYKGIDFYDDYAHHPTEIKEVLNGVMEVYKGFKRYVSSNLIEYLDYRSEKEFSLAFKNADEVILCPIYAAGEKIKLSFNYQSFAKEIIKNSNVKVFMVENQFQIAKFIKQTFYGKKIVIGMGAGSISSWMRELPKLI